MIGPAVTRPFLHLNCAVSADGRLAYAGGRRALLSGAEDRRRVQELRQRLDGILVGVGTVLLDDPSLRVHWEELGRAPGREPLRIVLDSRGRTPAAARVLQPPGATLVATTSGCARNFPSGVSVFRGGDSEVDLTALVTELARQGVRSVLVEGGARVFASFLRAGLWDRLTVYVAPLIIGGATAPPMVAGAETESAAQSLPMRLLGTERLGEGLLLEYAPAERVAGTPRSAPL